MSKPKPVTEWTFEEHLAAAVQRHAENPPPPLSNSAVLLLQRQIALSLQAPAQARGRSRGQRRSTAA